MIAELLDGLRVVAPIIVFALGASALAFLVGAGWEVLFDEDRADARRRNQARPRSWRDRL